MLIFLEREVLLLLPRNSSDQMLLDAMANRAQRALELCVVMGTPVSGFSSLSDGCIRLAHKKQKEISSPTETRSNHPRFAQINQQTSKY